MARGGARFEPSDTLAANVAERVGLAEMVTMLLEGDRDRDPPQRVRFTTTATRRAGSRPCRTDRRGRSRAHPSAARATPTTARRATSHREVACEASSVEQYSMRNCLLSGRKATWANEDLAESLKVMATDTTLAVARSSILSCANDPAQGARVRRSAERLRRRGASSSSTRATSPSRCRPPTLYVYYTKLFQRGANAQERRSSRCSGWRCARSKARRWRASSRENNANHSPIGPLTRWTTKNGFRIWRARCSRKSRPGTSKAADAARSILAARETERRRACNCRSERGPEQYLRDARRQSGKRRRRSP